MLYPIGFKFQSVPYRLSVMLSPTFMFLSLTKQFELHFACIALTNNHIVSNPYQLQLSGWLHTMKHHECFHGVLLWVMKNGKPKFYCVQTA